MKRRITLSIALVLSIGFVLLMGSEGQTQSFGTCEWEDIVLTGQ